MKLGEIIRTHIQQNRTVSKQIVFNIKCTSHQHSLFANLNAALAMHIHVK